MGAQQLTRDHAISFPQGICATALKKVCRKLGIEKWPYKDNKPVMTMPLLKKPILVSRGSTGGTSWNEEVP